MIPPLPDTGSFIHCVSTMDWIARPYSTWLVWVSSNQPYDSKLCVATWSTYRREDQWHHSQIVPPNKPPSSWITGVGQHPRAIGLMSRGFANGLGDWHSIPGHVIPKTQKHHLGPHWCYNLSQILWFITLRLSQKIEWYKDHLRSLSNCSKFSAEQSHDKEFSIF